MTPITATDPRTKSPDLTAANLAALRALFPELITEGKDGVAVNLDVLKQLLGDLTVTDAEEKYGLNWHGKRKARQLALTPSTGTLRPCPEDSVDWDTTQNLMIEGDNLEVLKLLQKSYAGKVKLIYIDPPYNTGKDFVYPDNFRDNIQNYLEVTGQTSEGGKKLSSNTEASGRFHTDWLNMMYPRLKLAKNLLREDGVIFISIGQTEISNLVCACDEILGEENRASICTRLQKTGGQKGKFFSPNTDYVLVYAKNIDQAVEFRDVLSEELIRTVYTQVETSGDRSGQRYRIMGLYQSSLDARANQRYFIECPDGSFVIPPGSSFPSEKNDGAGIKPEKIDDKVWRWTYRTYSEQKAKGNVAFKKTDTSPLITANGEQSIWNIYTKIWLDDRIEEGSLPLDIFDKFENRHSSQELTALDIPFDFAKPTDLVAYLARISGTADNDVILDFFAGSGTTGHSILKLNVLDEGKRRFILVQLPESIETVRFANIAEITKERLRRARKKIREENPLFAGDLGFRVFKLASSNILAWDPDREKLAETLEDSIEHLKTDRTEQDILFELLLKLGLDLCVPIETKKIGKHEVQSIGAGTLLVCLSEKIQQASIEMLALGIIAWHKELKPAGETTIVFRDCAFADDVAKTNLTAILHQHDLENVRSL